MSYHSNLDIMIKENKEVTDWWREQFGGHVQRNQRPAKPEPVRINQPETIATEYKCRKCGVAEIIPVTADEQHKLRFWIAHSGHGLDIYGITTIGEHGYYPDQE